MSSKILRRTYEPVVVLYTFFVDWIIPATFHITRSAQPHSLMLLSEAMTKAIPLGITRDQATENR
jgi:hypothetical protein